MVEEAYQALARELASLFARNDELERERES